LDQSGAKPFPENATSTEVQSGSSTYFSGTLAANSINNEDPTGDAKDVAHFWDEEWGHFEWHLGWFVLIAALALAERARVEPDVEVVGMVPPDEDVLTDLPPGLRHRCLPRA